MVLVCTFVNRPACTRARPRIAPVHIALVSFTLIDVHARMAASHLSPCHIALLYPKKGAATEAAACTEIADHDGTCSCGPSVPELNASAAEPRNASPSTGSGRPLCYHPSDAMHTQSKRERSSRAHVSARGTGPYAPDRGCGALRPAKLRTWTARERSSSVCMRQGRRMPRAAELLVHSPNALRSVGRSACVSASGVDA